ncbi:hypothetical protein I79_010904 [Cricetulus griseus]|uniref:Uncharacterized protein n=1 Tax=Cricetulus griseus TaxID=10029 RepID=G3HJQ5_CRIGR|nr:hypothetical protein I79_010904 [Cricetulus griseus]
MPRTTGAKQWDWGSQYNWVYEYSILAVPAKGCQFGYAKVRPRNPASPLPSLRPSREHFLWSSNLLQVTTGTGPILSQS